MKILKAIATVVVLAACMWAEAQQPQPPVGSQIYTISEDGAPLLWTPRVRVEGDFSGDGKTDVFEAWNVEEIFTPDSRLALPTFSGVWMTPSEDILGPDGNVEQHAGERQGPFPTGTVLGMSATQSGEVVVTIDAGAYGVDHILAWPGTPRSSLQGGSPADEVGAIDAALVDSLLPCAHYGCDYYRGWWKIWIASDMQPYVTLIELRLTDPSTGDSDRILTTTLDDWDCDGNSCDWLSTFCEPRAGDTSSMRARYNYTLHVHTENGLWSTDEPKQAKLWCG